MSTDNFDAVAAKAAMVQIIQTIDNGSGATRVNMVVSAINQLKTTHGLDFTDKLKGLENANTRYAKYLFTQLRNALTVSIRDLDV